MYVGVTLTIETVPDWKQYQQGTFGLGEKSEKRGSSKRVIVSQVVRFFVCMCGTSEEKIQVLEGLEKKGGLISLFGYGQVVTEFLTFYGEFYSPASTSSSYWSLSGFLSFFVDKKLVSEKLQGQLQPVLATLRNFALDARKREGQDVAARQVLEMREMVGKFIPDDVWQKALLYAKERGQMYLEQGFSMVSEQEGARSWEALSQRLTGLLEYSLVLFLRGQVDYSFKKSTTLFPIHPSPIPKPKNY